MPRDKHGRAVKDYGMESREKKEEHEEEGAGERKEEKKLEKSMDGHHDMLEHHMELHKKIEDRLHVLEKREGIHHKADGFKSEDQGGKEKAGAGHVTEKR